MLKRNGVLILTAVLICCVFLSLLPMSAAAQTEQEIVQGEESFEVVVVSKRDIIGADPDKKKLDADGIPAIKSTPEEKWIDRLDDPPTFVREFYDWLVENGDGDGREDALIQPTTGEYLFNQYYGHTVVTLEKQTLSFTYDSSTTTLATAGKAAMDQKEKALKAEMRGYYLATLASFDRDHTEVFWLGNQSSYIAWAHDITYRSTGSGTGEATYSVSLYAMLQYDGFDIRATEYQDATTIYATIKERDNMINTLAAQATGSRYEKIRFLNQWLTENNQYNTSADLNAISENCRNCIGALDGRIGTQGPVCEGYARAFKVLCDKLGIPCVLVNGANHMWNYVQMEDGKWYGVDVTWDDPTGGNSGAVSGGENERYLLVGSDTKIGGEAFIETHPVCNDVYDNNTKFTNGPVLSATKYEPYQEPAVTGIAIMTPPAKTVYGLGEMLDTHGLALTVYYSDGTMGFVDSGYTVSDFSSATTGEKTVAVTYKGQTATFTITVKTVIVIDIMVLRGPEKIEYWIGEKLDTTGLMLWVTYSDGNMEFVNTGYTVSGFDSKTTGTKTVTVTYREGMTTFDVMVKEKEPLETVIITQPESVVAKPGDTVTFTVVASGEGLSYQWKYKNATATSFINTTLEGNKTPTLTVPNLNGPNHNGRQYKCVITDASGAVLETDVVTLGVSYMISNAKSQTVGAGENAVFSVSYSIEEGVTYQWQFQRPGEATWANTGNPGNKTKTLTVAAKASINGYKYRCRITDPNFAEPIYSKEAELTVIENTFAITAQPESITRNPGEAASFTVVAEGEGLTYKWYYRNAGETAWRTTSLSGYNTATLNVSNAVVGATHNGRQYMCKITAADGSVVETEPATLTVIYMINDAKAQSVQISETAFFTVKHSDPGATYRWQYKGNTASATWANTSATGNKTNTLQVVAKATNNRYMYRCNITLSDGTVITSKEVYLNVVEDPATISADPADTSVVSGDYATFSVVAEGDGLVYQWQWSNDDASWANTKAKGYNTATLQVKTNNFVSGRYYRCVVKTYNGTGWNRTYTEAAQLTVLPAADILEILPETVTVKVGETATLHIGADGEGLTYQWQWAKFKGNWKNTSMTGATTDTLTIPGNKEYNGRYYRVVITNAYGGTIETKAIRLLVER